MLNKKTMAVAITVIDCPTEKKDYSATVKVEYGTPGTEDHRSRVFKDVFIQGLVKFRINSPKWPGFVTQKRYVSANNSITKDNPFKFVWTIDKDGKDVYSIYMVWSAPEDIETVPDLETGKDSVMRKWPVLTSDKWVRFIFPSKEKREFQAKVIAEKRAKITAKAKATRARNKKARELETA